MFYGYNAKCKQWKPERLELLVSRLAETLKLPIGYDGGDKPYIDPNNTSLFDDFTTGGVAIRRITHLSDKAIKALTKKADRVYFEVMKD
jgi:hypothetical protein